MIFFKTDGRGREDTIMNERIDSALQDITVIRETLDDTKVHYRGM